MDAFERAQRVAVRAMRTRMWQKAIGEEDPMMVAHIPQLVRINKLGMITTQSQSGVVRHYKSVRTGERRTMAERAFCYGFVRESAAGKILRWMWAHTDKYAVEVYIGADANPDFALLGVTTQDGGETWVHEGTALRGPFRGPRRRTETKTTPRAPYGRVPRARTARVRARRSAPRTPFRRARCACCSST
jgi:hypothetical protein